MKAALEAVFNHVSQEGKKVEPVSDTNKLDDGWVEHIQATHVRSMAIQL